MCGRFTLTTSDIIAREPAAQVEAESARLYRPRWNVAPTNIHWILRPDGVRRLVPARFGLEAGGGRFVINARIEVVAELRTFRAAFQDSRCVSRRWLLRSGRAGVA